MGKRFTFLSLIMLLLLGRTMAQSVDSTFNNGTANSYKLKFTVIEGTNECSVKVSRPATELTSLEIPTKVTIQNSDYYVTEIDSVAFRNCTKFSSVSLPDSLKMIRGRAFYNCSGLTGDLIIPDNVTYIGEYAFYGCYNIKGSLKLSEKLVTIGQYAFSRNSSNNTNMGFSGSLVIPNNVKTIGHYAFNYCTNLRGSLNMSESLTSIGDYAFNHCEGFTGDLIIPKNVKSIGDYAFYYCRGFNGKLVLPNGLTSIGRYAFSSGSDYYKMSFTGDLVIPNSVTSIGSYAFYNAGFNGDLILSESITNINSYTFSYCSFKGNLRIPNSVTSIGNSAFYSCSSFDGDLSLPANLATIGSSAFYGCSKFNVMYCYALTPPSAQSNSFTGHNISILYVPEESVDTYWETSPWNNEFFPLGLFKIEDYEVETKDENGNVLYSLIYSTTDDYSGVSVRIGQKPTTEVELVIPETLWYVEENFTYNVTTIPAEAFKDCSFFNGVEIPKYVNSIGENAFAGCSNIKIIKSLNPIPPSASGNSFKNTTARVAANSFDGIPATATLFVLHAYIDYYDIEPWNRFTIKPLLIDYEVFYYEGNAYYTLIYNLNDDYESLRVKIGRISGSPKTLNIPESIHDFNVTTIENKAFYYDGSLNTRVFETLVLSNTITHIGDSAFATYSSSYRLNLKGELIIPNSVTSIGNSAFHYCSSLTGELIIPKSVTSIGNSAFYNCSSLTCLSFENGSALESIGERAFYYCSRLTGELIIPNSVTSIGNYAFYNCNNLTGELIIPKSVTSIGNFAFSNCSSLTGLSFEAGSALESIGGSAFSSCSSLTGELIIPKSVTSIGYSAFYNCSRLTGLSFEAGSALESIGGSAFSSCYNLTGELIIPKSVTSIGYSAFYYCSRLTGELIIPKSVTSIGNSAFSNCSSLTGLSFEAGSALESIGDEAFYYCSGLTGELIIPNSVTSIGNYAFYNCNKLTGLSFEAGSALESIGDEAFRSCSGLTGELIIPNSVTSIGNYAFYNCNKLTGELIIPNSVTSIGNYAFCNCGFNRINCYSTTPASYSGSNSIFNSGTIYVPSISVESYKSAWYGDTSRINAYGFPTFVSDGSIDDVNNWYVLEDSGRTYRLPNENEEIAINAALIINNNEILNVKSLGYCENGDLTVKEGGQLRCNNINSDIKVEKSIAAHSTSGNTTWTTISSPFAADINPSNVTNLTSGNYDLYRYDEPSAVWQNYKNSANNGFTTLEAGRGYIYSHSDNTTLTFNGKSKASVVTYELTNESDILSGFHLVGNPYTHNITMDNMMTVTVEDVRFDSLTIVLNDSFGDGWDGDVAALQIVSDDGSINESFTLTDGYTETYGLKISYKPITIKWKRGNNDSEDSFVITNELGETVLSYERGTLASVADGAILYPTETQKDILVEGYYSLSNEGAWGAKLGDMTVIKPCQGILVKTTEEGTLKINSSVDASKDRSGAKRKHNDILSISVANEKYEDKAYVSFNGGVGLDKIAHENERIPMVYIPCQDADYAIAIQDKDFEEIPVNFEAGSMGEYTISISQKECGFKQLYLYDKVTDKIIDILRHDYTFFATTTEDPARFVLKPVCDVVLDEFAYINNGSLIIGNIVGNATINIYDVLGRSVLNSTCSDSEYDVSTERLASGVYIIHKSDDNGLKTQKVVIE